MPTRAELIEALAKGMRFTQSYIGKGSECWIDLVCLPPGEDVFVYRLGPYLDAALAVDELDAIFHEAGIV